MIYINNHLYKDITENETEGTIFSFLIMKIR